MRTTLFILLAGFTLMNTSCYPGGPEYYSDFDLVITHYNDTYDFGSKNTYFMPDQVPLIDGDTSTYDFVDAIYAAQMLAAIEQNMNARGYQRVGENDDPDILLTASALTVTNVTVDCGWWGYWGGWWGYPGYPGYGGCYYPVAYSYETGTLFITLWDKDGLPNAPEQVVNAEWTVGINGLLEGSTADRAQRALSNINKAFDQSPYIQSN
jgi:hypothetical protein